jgi:hypothetical protein
MRQCINQENWKLIYLESTDSTKHEVNSSLKPNSDVKFVQMQGINFYDLNYCDHYIHNTLVAKAQLQNWTHPHKAVSEMKLLRNPLLAGCCLPFFKRTNKLFSESCEVLGCTHERVKRWTDRRQGAHTDLS